MIFPAGDGEANWPFLGLRQLLRKPASQRRTDSPLKQCYCQPGPVGEVITCQCHPVPAPVPVMDQLHLHLLRKLPCNIINHKLDFLRVQYLSRSRRPFLLNPRSASFFPFLNLGPRVLFLYLILLLRVLTRYITSSCYGSGLPALIASCALLERASLLLILFPSFPHTSTHRLQQLYIRPTLPGLFL